MYGRLQTTSAFETMIKQIIFLQLFIHSFRHQFQLIGKGIRIFFINHICPISPFTIVGCYPCQEPYSTFIRHKQINQIPNREVNPVHCPVDETNFMQRFSVMPHVPVGKHQPFLRRFCISAFTFIQQHPRNVKKSPVRHAFFYRFNQVKERIACPLPTNRVVIS